MAPQSMTSDSPILNRERRLSVSEVVVNLAAQSQCLQARCFVTFRMAMSNGIDNVARKTARTSSTGG